MMSKAGFTILIRKADDIYNKVRRRFFFNKKVQLLRKFSADAMSDIQDGSVDWIYIDGNHSYEFVYEDLNGWCQKLKSGAIYVAMIILMANIKLSSYNSELFKLSMSFEKKKSLILFRAN